MAHTPKDIVCFSYRCAKSIYNDTCFTLFNELYRFVSPDFDKWFKSLNKDNTTPRDTAVFFVHGVRGDEHHFMRIIYALKKDKYRDNDFNFDCFNHTYQEFDVNEVTKFKETIQKQYKKYHNIILVGHSRGGDIIFKLINMLNKSEKQEDRELYEKIHQALVIVAPIQGAEVRGIMGNIRDRGGFFRKMANKIIQFLRLNGEFNHIVDNHNADNKHDEKLSYFVSSTDFIVGEQSQQTPEECPQEKIHISSFGHMSILLDQKIRDVLAKILAVPSTQPSNNNTPEPQYTYIQHAGMVLKRLFKNTLKTVGRIICHISAIVFFIFINILYIASQLCIVLQMFLNMFLFLSDTYTPIEYLSSMIHALYNIILCPYNIAAVLLLNIYELCIKQIKMAYDFFTKLYHSKAPPMCPATETTAVDCLFYTEDCLTHYEGIDSGMFKTARDYGLMDYLDRFVAQFTNQDPNNQNSNGTEQNNTSNQLDSNGTEQNNTSNQLDSSHLSNDYSTITYINSNSSNTTQSSSINGVYTQVL